MGEGVRTLGTLWSSSLFPGRAPPDYNLLLNYIGGSRDIGLADLSEEKIIEAVDEGCRQVLLQKDAPPAKFIGMKIWPTAIPQYELGHLPLIQELEMAESKLPGLWICGNYRTGVAFPDCVTFGYDHAKVVKSFLDQQPKKSKKEKESTIIDADVATANGDSSEETSTTTATANEESNVETITTTAKKERKVPFFM